MSQHPPVTERAEALIVYIQVDQSALLLQAGSGPRTVYLTAFQLKPPNRLKQKKMMLRLMQTAPARWGRSSEDGQEQSGVITLASTRGGSRDSR